MLNFWEPRCKPCLLLPQKLNAKTVVGKLGWRLHLSVDLGCSSFGSSRWALKLEGKNGLEKDLVIAHLTIAWFGADLVLRLPSIFELLLSSQGENLEICFHILQLFYGLST